MTLKEIREDYVRYSTNVSNLSRNLAYAGIGIVWIFKHTNSENVDKALSMIPVELRLPLILFIVVLIIDLFQYFVQILIWYPYYVSKKKENRDKNEEDVILNEPEKYNIIPWLLWLAKLIVVIVAYYIMGLFLLG